MSGAGTSIVGGTRSSWLYRHLECGSEASPKRGHSVLVERLTRPQNHRDQGVSRGFVQRFVDALNAQNAFRHAGD
jgi:hypothetical protein